MSSVEKGTAFENKVHQILIDLLEKNELGISGIKYKIHHQKEFYSYLRKSNIKFDLVIEFFRVEGAKPSFYIMVECKDYGGPIPVSDLEEFLEKCKQVFHANFKCMVFTTSSLQQSAYNYADSTGMAVIRILDDDSRTWLIERTTKHLTTSPSNSITINVHTALTNEYYLSSKQDTFGSFNNKVFTSVQEIFSAVIKSIKAEVEW